MLLVVLIAMAVVLIWPRYSIALLFAVILSAFAFPYVFLGLDGVLLVGVVFGACFAFLSAIVFVRKLFVAARDRKLNMEVERTLAQHRAKERLDATPRSN